MMPRGDFVFALLDITLEYSANLLKLCMTVNKCLFNKWIYSSFVPIRTLLIGLYGQQQLYN